VAGPPDPNVPESVILGAFNGLRNNVAPERLGQADLERAVNVDIDDAGQLRRRRGYDRKDTGAWHSLRTICGKALGVREGILGIIRPDYSFKTLVGVGAAPICFTDVNEEVFFSGAGGSGVVLPDETTTPWGATDGQGTWSSPVMLPTETLGEVSGQLLGDPPRATSIAAYSGRIYLAVDKTLWATELFRYHYVDRTRGFVQFEHTITLLWAAQDGLYVGTTGGLYFLKGVFGAFRLSTVVSDPVLPGSCVTVPTEQVHPSARNGPIPAGDAATIMTGGGVLACFDGGTAFNLTQGRVVFPAASSAAALFREDQGVSSYVAAIGGAGGTASTARIGDYVDAEIIRASQRGD
jgi:hypothetical protein